MESRGNSASSSARSNPSSSSIRMAVEPLPDPRLGPAIEPFLLGLKRAVLGWQVLPRNPGSQHEQHGIEEPPVVAGGASRGQTPLPGNLSSIFAHGLVRHLETLENSICPSLPSLERLNATNTAKTSNANCPQRLGHREPSVLDSRCGLRRRTVARPAKVNSH